MPQTRCQAVRCLVAISTLVLIQCGDDVGNENDTSTTPGSTSPENEDAGARDAAAP